MSLQNNEKFCCYGNITRYLTSIYKILSDIMNCHVTWCHYRIMRNSVVMVTLHVTWPAYIKMFGFLSKKKWSHRNSIFFY